MIGFKRGWPDFARQCPISHLPPPPLLEHDSDDSVVIATRNIELSLVGLVWVYQKLWLRPVFFLPPFLFFGVFLCASDDFATPVRLPEEGAVGARLAEGAEGIGGALLGGDACGHVWAHHAILFVDIFVEAD